MMMLQEEIAMLEQREFRLFKFNLMLRLAAVLFLLAQFLGSIDCRMG
jgi:hypothetical protein